MKRIEYDTAAGIQEHLGSLDALHEMLAARSADQDSQSLHYWTLMGRFSLQAFGNVGRYYADGDSSFIPADVLPLIPDVIEERKAIDLIGGVVRTDSRVTLAMTLGNPEIPTSHVCCGECGAGWTVRTAHDAVSRHDHVPMGLSGFEGYTAKEVNEALRDQQPEEAIYRLNPSEWSVRGEACDGAPASEWRYVGEEYTIQPFEEALVGRQRFTHKGCDQQRIKREARELYVEMLEEAGFDGYELEEVVNQYGSAAYAGPWFKVNTDSGKPILIGRRKRVFALEWRPEDFSGDITGGDEVTKSATTAHAWSKEDAIRYLSNLDEAFTRSTTIIR